MINKEYPDRHTDESQMILKLCLKHTGLFS